MFLILIIVLASYLNLFSSFVILYPTGNLSSLLLMLATSVLSTPTSTLTEPTSSLTRSRVFQIIPNDPPNNEIIKMNVVQPTLFEFMVILFVAKTDIIYSIGI